MRNSEIQTSTRQSLILVLSFEHTFYYSLKFIKNYNFVGHISYLMSQTHDFGVNKF